MNYDVLIIGAGIAGLESSLSLGDMGYKVLLVRDAHSTTYINPESMIEQTNNTLESEGIVELIYTDDVVFE